MSKLFLEINLFTVTYFANFCCVLHGNIDETLMSSLQGLLNCEIGGLDCHVITTEYRTSVH